MTFFWRRHPALFAGMHLLIGLCLRQTPWALLGLLPLMRRDWRWLPGLLITLSAFVYSLALFKIPEPPPEGIVGEAWIKIDRVVDARKGWLFQGKLRRFTSNGELIAKNSRVTLMLRKKPPANRDYLVNGRLMPGGRLKVEGPWYPVKASWSSAEWRARAKKAIAGHLKSRMQNQRSARFLAALTTGEFADLSLLFSFSRLGLQHLMAISGFHFSLVALTFGLLIKSWMRHRLAALFLIIFVTAYLFLVGGAPSMVRAWIMTVMLFSGWLLERPTSSLNSLGGALLLLLLWDPLAARSLGFQLSFLCAAAILFFCGPIDRAMRSFLPCYTPQQVLQMRVIDRFGAVGLSFMRRGVSIGLAVHIVALPISLYAFHRFPIMSLFYNLFVPIGISILLFLLPFGLIVGKPIMILEEKIASAILNFASSVPPRLDFQFRVEHFSSWTILLYLNLLLLVGIFLSKRSCWTREAVL